MSIVSLVSKYLDDRLDGLIAGQTLGSSVIAGIQIDLENYWCFMFLTTTTWWRETCI